MQRGGAGSRATLAARVVASAEEPWRSAFERAYVDDAGRQHGAPKTTEG